MASFEKIYFLGKLKRIVDSQLLSGFGSDDVLHDDLVLALEAVGDAQEHRRVAEEAVRVLLASGDLCGVAV